MQPANQVLAVLSQLSLHVSFSKKYLLGAKEVNLFDSKIQITRYSHRMCLGGMNNEWV